MVISTHDDDDDDDDDDVMLVGVRVGQPRYEIPAHDRVGAGAGGEFYRILPPPSAVAASSGWVPQSHGCRRLRLLDKAMTLYKALPSYDYYTMLRLLYCATTAMPCYDYCTGIL